VDDEEALAGAVVLLVGGLEALDSRVDGGHFVSVRRRERIKWGREGEQEMPARKRQLSHVGTQLASQMDAT